MPGFCSGCGKPAGEVSHRRCEERARATDTPRFCAACGRKLKVQILPRGWRAECVSCGPLDGGERDRPRRRKGNRRKTKDVNF